MSDRAKWRRDATEHATRTAEHMMNAQQHWRCAPYRVICMASWKGLILLWAFVCLMMMSVDAQESSPPSQPAPQPPPGRPGFVQLFLPQILACLSDPNTCTKLSYNFRNLEGTLPTEIGLLTKLTSFEMFGNLLESTIPTEFGLCTDLTKLGLGRNQLIGALPTELGRLTKLTELALSTNQLNGTIPTELAQLLKLEILALDSNRFHGTIPTQVGLLSRLKTFWIHFQPQLSGTIPTELGLWTNATIIAIFASQVE
eukprot:6182465-Pyramimonas_sp.AAC.2